MKQFLEISTEKAASVREILQKAGLTEKQISRAKFQTDGICRNGRRCRVTEQARPGDVLRVSLESEKKSSGHLEAPPAGLSEFSVLYEDENVLAVNKPAGLVTHPQGRHYRDSLANQAAQYFREKGQEICVHAVGRLDKETSGIVLFGKSQAAAAALQRQREQNLLKKTYLAAVRGELPKDSPGQWHTIEIPLAADPENPLKQRAVLAQEPGGRRAVTHYQTLCSCSCWSLLRLCLDTGRTHQIRAHMAAIGHPLFGDRLYGGANFEDGGNCREASARMLERPELCGSAENFPGRFDMRPVPEFSRTALHAWKVEFRLPFRKEKIRLEAPLPEDFERNWSGRLPC